MVVECRIVSRAVRGWKNLLALPAGSRPGRLGLGNELPISIVVDDLRSGIGGAARVNKHAFAEVAVIRGVEGRFRDTPRAIPGVAGLVDHFAFAVVKSSSDRDPVLAELIDGLFKHLAWDCPAYGILA